MNLDEIIDRVKYYQNNPQQGINFPFVRFKEYLPCISKGDSYLIVGGSASGKTAVVIDLFVQSCIRECLSKGIDFHIDYFQLEETPLRHDLRILSNLMYHKTGLEYTINDFLNKKGDSILKGKEHELELVRKEVDFMNEHITVHMNEKTPSSINRAINNSVQKLKKQNKDYNNDKFYHIIIVDNLKFLKLDNGHLTLKQAIDDLCLNVLQKYRVDLNIIPVVLQHEAEDADDVVVSVKGDLITNKLKPSLKRLGVSKYTQDPATHVIGIFHPSRFDITVYPEKVLDSKQQIIKGYDLKKLHNNFRTLIILKGRDGGERVEIPVYFKGGVSVIEELPPCEDFHKNANLYNNYK